MAKRKILFSFGQSHATTVSDAATWEDEHPTIAIRKPTVSATTPFSAIPPQLPQFPEGGPRELFTMPGTFAGGRQSGLFGDGPPASVWQTVDCSGKVVSAVRFLTFYHPVASALNVGTSVASTFPGTGVISVGSTPTVLNTTTRWQYSPVNLVITRVRTGTTHTITASGALATNSITISPAMVPPPEVGEQFTFVPTGGASSSTTELKLVQAFGGLADIGSLLEVPPYCSPAAGYHVTGFRRVRDSGGTNVAGRVSMPSRLGYVGAPILFAPGPSYPTGVTAGTTYYIARYAGDFETLPLVTASWDAALDRISVAGHGLILNEKVRFSGVLPPELSSTTDYYILVVSENLVQVSLTVGGAAVAFSSGGGTATLTRMESSFHFFLADSPGGTEKVFDADVDGLGQMSVVFRGSLTGLHIRALTGPNAGTSVPAGDIYMSSGIHTIKLGAAFANAPSAGDTYAIEVPPIDGQTVPFEKWALFLPWCPFEGAAVFSGPFAVGTGALTESAPIAGVPQPMFVQSLSMDIWPGDMLRLVNGDLSYSSAMTTQLLTFGVRYFASEASNGAAFLTSTYGGATIYGAVNAPATGGQSCYLLRQEGKINPFPPGFNYPNHLVPVGDYQPFDGPSLIAAPKQTFVAGLAVSLAEYYGETIYVVQLAVGGTNLGHTDVPPTTFGFGTNTYDPKKQLSWSPTGDPNNIFQRLLDVLDATVLALRAQGDEGEAIGVIWTQGEGDSSFEYLADRYLVNGRRFRSAVRQAIVDRGLFSRPAAELRWLEPYCQKEPWPYHEVVRSAKDTLVAEDPYSALCELDDLPRLNSLPGTANGDPIHMTGAGAAELGRRLYAAWISISETNVEVDIANMALGLIGEPAKVFSLDPAIDQSVQAAECAKFLPVAKEVILESHSWAFATKVVQLTQVATKDALRTDWVYAYTLPADLLNALEVRSADTPAVTESSTAELTPWWRNPSSRETVNPNGNLYAIEPDNTGTLVLYTNVENAVLRYVRKITPAVTVPMKFKTAVARKLASLIAGQFVKGAAGAELAQKLDMMSRMETNDAAVTDAKHRTNNPNAQQMPWSRE